MTYNVHPVFIGVAAGAALGATYEYFVPAQSNEFSHNYRPQPSRSMSASSTPSNLSPPNRIGGKFTDARRAQLRKIGEETLDTIHRGHYTLRGVEYSLKEKVKESKKSTEYYPPDAGLDQWAATPKPQRTGGPDGISLPTHISILEISTMDAARLLESVYTNNPGEICTTGVLNFASATKPGGGFQNGAEAQEESIARASTLYPTLMTDNAQKFYKLHKLENEQNARAYYSHAMIYSPKITVFRDDDGLWTRPFDVDVLTCAAVNAGEILKNTVGPTTSGVNVSIEKEMTERMGRILFLFEQKGVRNIVLGTFGTGVFKNDIATVTRIWASLLLLPTARFLDSFDRIIFAVTGEDTFANFNSGFEAWANPKASGTNAGRGKGVKTSYSYRLGI